MRENPYTVNSREWWEEYFVESWDAHSGGEQTRYFMERLIAELPVPEIEFLRSKPLRILDWGCAFGEGVELLAQTFPHSDVVGLDFASRAVEEARRRHPNRQFILSENGEISGEFGLIVASNCLEHFEYPLEVIRTHLRSCKKLYIILVPYNEFPLSEYHRSQFKKESFPEHIGDFVRLCARTVDTDPLYWNGQQLLVVYGSQSYLGERAITDDKELEQKKWDKYYASLPLHEADQATQLFNAELVERISELLPSGGRILEAGCGGGWQGLALARSGKFQVSLMDFSHEALAYARRLFEREQLSAEFIYGDVFTPGAPDFDLVFNAGVLEHYTLEEQAAFLRGMASRSRKYVMALVPNRLCYWYWLWRIQKSSHGDWPFGKEVPLIDFSAAFEAAGLQFLGQTFMGQTWAEFFISDLSGMSRELCDEILEIHRSPLIPEQQKSYLLAALGSISPEAKVPRIWMSPPLSEDMQKAEMIAAFADTLALRIGAEQGLSRLQMQVWEKERSLQRLSAQIAEKEQKTQSLSSQIMEKEQTVQSLSSQVLEKEQAVQSLSSQVMEKEQAVETLSAQLAWKASQLESITSSLGWRLANRAGLIKGAILYRYLMPVYRKSGLDRYLTPVYRKLSLARSKTEMGGDNQMNKAYQAQAHIPYESNACDIVCFPIIDWDFRFQRPQQLMLRFAAAGHRVFYIAQRFRSSGEPYSILEKGHNIYQVSLRAPERNSYTDVLDEQACDALFDSLDALRRDLFMGATAAFVQLPFWWPLAKKARSEFAWPIIYDCMDQHAGFSTNLQGMVEQERDLLLSADLVVVSSAFLEDKAQQHNSNVLLLRNACDYEHFAKAGKPKGNQPVIGYYGAIADWFDSDLVADLAERRPDWEFVLVGSTFSADISRLSKLPNVSMPGEKPYLEIPSWLEKFDVATIPFKRLPLTEATNPVKAYEILASGKPLVSVPLPEVASLAPLVRLASNTEEFEREIEAALGENEPELFEKRRAFARENTWERRYEVLAPVVRDTFPKASIIIVTFNNLLLNKLCLESLYGRTEWPNYEVIVVDNASSDGTPEYLKQAEKTFPNLRVILNERNMGFAAANNVALKQAKGDYLVLLNNDTVLARGWLSALIRHLHTDPQIGLIGPVTNEIGNEAKVPVSYQQLEDMPVWAANFVRENDGFTFEIPMLAMYCIVMRRKVFEEVGLLDESFEVGMFEDDDYTNRVREKGYKVICARDSFVHHAGGAAFKMLNRDEYDRIFQKNRKAYENKWKKWEPHKGFSEASNIILQQSITKPANNFKRQEESSGAPRVQPRGRAIKHVGRFPGMSFLPGTCNVCGTYTKFFYKEEAYYRESLICGECLTTSRYRSIARGILQAIRELTGVEAVSIAELNPAIENASLKIYDTQMPFYYKTNAYPIPDLLSRCKWIDLQTSLYRPQDTLGIKIGPNATNQNLEGLTFPNNSFDIVITSDVMEHVRLDDRAHREIARVLKPGGIYLFTVPHMRDRCETFFRVAVTDPSDPTKDLFLAEKEYHGDANSADGKALCYRVYGTELDNRLKEIGFAVNYCKQDFPEIGIMNTELFFCRLSS